MDRSKVFRPGPNFVIKSTKVFINHLKGKNRKGQSKLERLIQYPLAVPFFSSLVSPTPVRQILYGPDPSFLPSLEECFFCFWKFQNDLGSSFWGNFNSETCFECYFWKYCIFGQKTNFFIHFCSPSCPYRFIWVAGNWQPAKSYHFIHPKIVQPKCIIKSKTS